MKPIIPPGNLRYEMFSKGLFLENMVPRSRIQALADKLYPSLCGFPLTRLGAKEDGGYLVPDDFNGVRACFSPGVDTYASFETDLLERYSIGSHLADYSVDDIPKGLKALSFIKKFIGSNTEGNHVSLKDWVLQYEPEAKRNELILQMDIEGAEYATLLSCPDELLEKFRIMVIEFHDVETWTVNHFMNIVEATFSKLLRTHFVVHNHPNNAMGLVDIGGYAAPRIFELTFLARTRGIQGAQAITPNPLDFPNVAYLPPLDLNDCWKTISNDQ
jgi:Methyltransferase FkbM domain